MSKAEKYTGSIDAYKNGVVLQKDVCDCGLCWNSLTPRMTIHVAKGKNIIKLNHVRHSSVSPK